MEEIRILSQNELFRYTEIAANAFPILKINTKEEIEKFSLALNKRQETGFSAGNYGFFSDAEMQGGMILYDFTANILNKNILMGGIGLVSVDLMHKKEKVCKKMLHYFLSHYHGKGAFITALFAFKLGFYQKMGFGFGTKTKQYQIGPSSLSKGNSKKMIRLLKKEDMQLMLDYYNKQMNSHHGNIALSQFEIERIFEESKHKLAGYCRNGRIEGYIKFSFIKDASDDYNMLVSELVYDNREVLSELLSFLNSQADQVKKILINTNDEYFQFITDNPSNGSETIYLHHQTNVEEIGIMYRIINTRLFFEAMKDHNFGGVTFALKLNINDSFFEENNGTITIKFENGMPHIIESGAHDTEITINIADFTSMVMGVVPFSNLHVYSQVEISDTDFISVIDRIFHTPEKPYCHTRF